MNTRSDLLEHLHYMADLSRLEGTTRPRMTVYLPNWRCSFGPLSEILMPVDHNGITMAKWMATGIFYDKTQIPLRGDRFDNLRLIRTGLEMNQDKLTVVEVHPHPAANAYIVLLTESAVR